VAKQTTHVPPEQVPKLSQANTDCGAQTRPIIASEKTSALIFFTRFPLLKYSFDFRLSDHVFLRVESPNNNPGGPRGKNSRWKSLTLREHIVSVEPPQPFETASF